MSHWLLTMKILRHRMCLGSQIRSLTLTFRIVMKTLTTLRKTYQLLLQHQELLFVMLCKGGVITFNQTLIDQYTTWNHPPPIVAQLHNLTAHDVNHEVSLLCKGYL